MIRYLDLVISFVNEHFVCLHLLGHQYSIGKTIVRTKNILHVFGDISILLEVFVCLGQPSVFYKEEYFANQDYFEFLRPAETTISI